MSKKKVYEYEGRKYAFIEDKEEDECERCALKDKCHDEDGLICTDLLGISNDNAVGRRFEEVNEDALTEDDVYDYYQERSVKAGERADQLAWMFIVMMTGGLISGHAFQTFSICAMLAAIYMLLSVVQAVWQTFTSWLFKNIIHRTGDTPEDYPSWVGGGAWFFFWAKMITIASAVIYFAKAILF